MRSYLPISKFETPFFADCFDFISQNKNSKPIVNNVSEVKQEIQL